MKNKQTIIFLILLLIIGGVLVSRYFESKKEIMDVRSKEKNTAETITLEGPKKYTAGKGEFKEGYYDIDAKEEIDTNSFTLGKNQKLVALELNKMSVIQLSEKQTVVLTASKFEPIMFHNGVAELKNTIGYFQCGNEIDAGSYEITVNTRSQDALFGVHVQSDDTTNSSEFTINNKKVAKITLEKGDLLNIFFVDYKVADFRDFTIRIKKVS